ncbi:MAG: hypothetical protein QXI93_02525 [Candidatus Methanomethylicia archaeon]
MPENGGNFMNLNLEYFLDDQIKKLLEIVEGGCRKFEEETNTDVILLLMSPDWATIDRDVVDDLWMHLKKRTFSKDGISVILHSTGGDADAAYHLSIIF